MESHRYLTSFQKEVTSLSYQNDDFRRLENPYRTFAINKILSLLEFYKSSLKIKDLSTAAFMIHTSIEAIVHELSFFPDEAHDEEKVISEFAEMLYNYLFKTPAPRDDWDQTDRPPLGMRNPYALTGGFSDGLLTQAFLFYLSFKINSEYFKTSDNFSSPINLNYPSSWKYLLRPFGDTGFRTCWCHK